MPEVDCALSADKTKSPIPGNRRVRTRFELLPPCNLRRGLAAIVPRSPGSCVSRRDPRKTKHHIQTLAALSPCHREALVDFLCGAFNLPKTAPFVEPALLRWRYDEPRPDWQGLRSYAWFAAHSPGSVLESKDIVAHACICPVVYRLGQQDICGSYLIDWAASRRTPGAGALLLRNLASLRTDPFPRGWKAPLRPAYAFPGYSQPTICGINSPATSVSRMLRPL